MPGKNTVFDFAAPGPRTLTLGWSVHHARGGFSGLRPPAPVLSGGSRITVRSSPGQRHESTSRSRRHHPCAYIMKRDRYPRHERLWLRVNFSANVIPAPLARFTCERESAGIQAPQCLGALAVLIDASPRTCRPRCFHPIPCSTVPWAPASAGVTLVESDAHAPTSSSRRRGSTTLQSLGVLALCDTWQQIAISPYPLPLRPLQY